MNASYDAAEGFGLRAVRGDAAGYAHSTELSIDALRRAAETAARVDKLLQRCASLEARCREAERVAGSAKARSFASSVWSNSSRT